VRATVFCFASLVALSSVAFATPQGDSTPTGSLPSFYLRGYYKLDDRHPTWQASDSSPWSQLKKQTPWVNPRLVKWGYIPFEHNAKNYYCLIEEGARTGSHLADTTFMCGDPNTVQWLFQNNWRPSVLMIGGGPPLESSLRRRPSGGT
jgi:hypothetical protein